MNFSFFIAKKYLVSKKNANIINIISFIAIVGVAFGTMAFIVVLSVFNGIEGLVSSLFNSFDPDLRVEVNEGKSFSTDSLIFDELKNYNEVAYMSFIIEENALLEYDGKQVVATMKAVDENYINVTGVDTMLYDGSFVLNENPRQYAVIGHGIAARLGVGLNLIYPLKIWAPLRTQGITLNSNNAFNADIINLSAIFAVQQEYDNKYVIIPLDFAQNLMNYENRATTIEIKLVQNANVAKSQEHIAEILGDGFVVKNRFEQKQLVYKIMKSEKWATIAILSFILLVSSFNIIGTMIMLIIEKKDNLSTMHSMGADIDKIRKIFLFEGWMISATGAVIGLIIGLIISLGQQTFGWLKFSSTGSFVQSVYPVQVNFTDVIFVLIIVLSIGYIVANYPVRFITKKFFTFN
ncbi:MAG: ABC transporter permease [Bacteroidales bacterium]|nr:ABC transporter permease [Bacteroidales bacterium]